MPKAAKFIGLVILLSLLVIGVLFLKPDQPPAYGSDAKKPEKVNDFWQAPDTSLLDHSEASELIKYGRRLISHTSLYLGPQGTVARMSNGMNCQNCHLDAGTRVFGNNYGAVASTYPKFRARSGTIETIQKRVNDCLERSLNGKALQDSSREMKAIVAYIRWVGSEVPKGISPKGSGLVNVEFIDRPADPEKGKLLYRQKCSVCHGENGEGLMKTTGTDYAFPPLWGPNSYNTGAGLFRLSRFAGYIKANMPFGASYDSALLRDDECWDIAAFVNSMPRPEKDLAQDWPDISKKPYDHPFGPYADEFTERQHKYGPFARIAVKGKQ